MKFLLLILAPCCYWAWVCASSLDNQGYPIPPDKLFPPWILYLPYGPSDDEKRKRLVLFLSIFYILLSFICLLSTIKYNVYLSQNVSFVNKYETAQSMNLTEISDGQVHLANNWSWSQNIVRSLSWFKITIQRNLPSFASFSRPWVTSDVKNLLTRRRGHLRRVTCSSYSNWAESCAEEAHKHLKEESYRKKV